MKVAEWKREVRPLLLAESNWQFSRNFCYRAPVHRVAVGVLGEGSGFDKGVYIWQVRMPLFVPEIVFVLSYSHRVGGRSMKYQMNDRHAMHSAISTAIDSAADESSVIEYIADLGFSTPNRNLNEAVGYSLLLLGDDQSAFDALEKAAAGEAEQTWAQVIIDRVRGLQSILELDGRDAAIRQLDRWSAETATALGLVH